MKLTLTTLVFAAICTTSNIALACQTTVMGGCVQEPTHDTSSHMKSQIVNKVEAPKETIAQTGNEKRTKIGANKAGNSSLVQSATKAVIK